MYYIYIYVYSLLSIPYLSLRHGTRPSIRLETQKTSHPGNRNPAKALQRESGVDPMPQGQKSRISLGKQRILYNRNFDIIDPNK